MRIWEGVWWSLGALALYLAGWRFSSDADVLESVPRINLMSELAKLLEFRRTPLVVGVSGTVCCENPIHCEFAGLRGVVVMQTDDGTGRVNVVGATGASGFTFPASSGQFEQSRRCHECETKRSVVCERIDDREGVKFTMLKYILPSSTSESGHNKQHSMMDSSPLIETQTEREEDMVLLGVQRTEHVLPIGISLSVVGEAVKDNVGTIRIQKPHKGPFYVSTKSIDELIASHKNWARFLKCASFGVAVIGLTLIAAELDKYIRERLCGSEWLRSRRRAAAVADIRSRQHNAGSSDTRAVAADYIRSQRDNAGERAAAAPDGANSCVICLEQQYNVVFIPCGHMCCCTTCCSQLTECPLCRQPFSQAVRTFRP
ncbi:hypothetical protein C1H46_027998 [Malus baccata]|uniref:RING-type E3 ubiquitin transferase n=1 Tax=Malus baccata TaxID=106549 RepID=A0A540LJK9_MALBA|nr:hypothetical protein C1H46_027998 [Malus baccata]